MSRVTWWDSDTSGSSQVDVGDVELEIGKSLFYAGGLDTGPSIAGLRFSYFSVTMFRKCLRFLSCELHSIVYMPCLTVSGLSNIATGMFTMLQNPCP